MTLTADKEVNNRKIPLSGMTLDQLRKVVLDNGLPSFNAKQIAAWLYKRRVSSIEEMTDLSKKAREALSLKYCIGRVAPNMWQKSADGTIKYVFAISGGYNIESVYIPDRERATLCVSSQGGCRMNCRFCMTGHNGFHGQLGSHEIINQVLSIPESDTLTNIVFMGMGEPLDNYEAVRDSIEILTAEWGRAWSPKRITVSTIGKTDGLKMLLNDTKVHVAVSLHSPFGTEREQLMPVEKKYHIKDVIDLLKNYDFTGQRRCSFEYIMWKGLNDDEQHARELARLISPVKGCRVNLIRFHSFPEEPELKPCSQAVMENFRDYLNSKGIIATIRASRGEDILAACGMLAGSKT